MQINIVTTNHGKFLEIKEVLEKYKIEANHIDLDVNEEGNTLEERCVSKAKNAFSLTKKPLIVDDTGVFIEAFDNFPGPFPKEIFRELGLEGIMKRLEGKKRDACFKTIICYIDEKRHHIFEGVVKGVITERIYDGGKESLPYDRILIPAGYKIPFCKMSTEEKNAISHRAKAVENFAKWFSNHI